MKKVVLVRGPSGCGKSTYIRQLLNARGMELVESIVCSADDFFITRTPVVNVDGSVRQETVLEYRFDPMKLGEAHAWCFGKFMDAIYTDGYSMVVVDNTFIHMWEMKNYFKAARRACCDLEVHEFRVETIAQLRLCVARNVHRVPADVVARMAMEFEPYEGAMVLPLGGLK